MLFELLLTLITITLLVIWLLDITLFKRITLQPHISLHKYMQMLIAFAKSYLPVFALVLVLRSFLFEPFRIPSGSMLPTLLIGDFILANKYAYGVKLPVTRTTIIPIATPKRGDIVVFQEKGTDRYLIKRIIGIPGDLIEYKNEKLYVNNALVKTEFIKTTNSNLYTINESKELLPRSNNTTIDHNIYHYPHRYNKIRYHYTKIKVSDKHYFVMGDNRNDSEDSRMWGLLPEKNLVGKAVITWLSLGESFKIRFNRFGKKIV